MSLSAERVAIANQAVLKTFEQSSVFWQTIPHWDTGDRGQHKIREDITFSSDGAPDDEDPQPGEGPFASKLVDISDNAYVLFRVTLGQATAQTPDPLLAAVIARTVRLARLFDAEVSDALTERTSVHVDLLNTEPPAILTALLEGRKRLEDSGFRAPSCLIASTRHYGMLHQWIDGVAVADDLLKAASVGSLSRSSQLDKPDSVMLMLGRRQDIAHRCAGEASAGEEPVDLAVSVPPSLEVIGDNGQGEIELGVRVRYATRVKDERGVIVFNPPPQ
ncbi:MAG TPA: hypothetical protein VK735_08770 [Pseudonocardia sp.]|uniref:hypothetical protein n=1 Tax=Pseudonocardia sp. TaxID=60912 RepID=UPI002BDAA5DA|nr:hypothetical protein [Pseudonocardia sp.]HTF47525.1 hypothetical protein [Pseudonocardia sp.]